MRALRVIRWSAFAGIALFLAAIVVFKFAPGMRDFLLSPSDRTVSASNEDTVSVPGGVPIGGAFELTDDKRHTVTDADYRGRWMLVFFGYSNCPDECPLTLQKMATTLQDLGPLADRVAPLFITVDPVRDTPERLGSYLENFDTRITGLTGSDEQIAAVAKAYRVYYEPSQNEQSGTDLLSHSTFLYLMDPGRKAERALFPGSDARETHRCSAHAPVVVAARRPIQFARADDTMMPDMAGMMWGMGLVWLIVIIVLVLALLPACRSRCK